MNFTGTITGRLISSELKFSQGGGKPFWRGRIAVNHKRKNPQTNAYEDSGTTWVSATVFGHLAENAANRLQDKMLVTAAGRMETREWDKDDGAKGQSLEMVADTVSEAVAPWPDKNNTPAPSPAPASNGWGSSTGAWGGAPAAGGTWGTPDPNQPSF